MAGNGYVCGWYGENAQVENSSEILNSMRQVFTSLSSPASLDSTTLKLLTTGDVYESSNKCDVAIYGLPYWKSDDLIEYSRLNGHAATCEKAYLEYGLKFFSKLAGRFVVVINDNINKKCVLAIDRLGQQQLYFFQSGQNIIFGSRLDSVTRHPDVKQTLSNQSVFNYLYYHAIPSPGSIFKDIGKLQNGEYLVFENNKIKREKYWNPTFIENTVTSSDDLGEEMREIIQRSVSRVAGTPNVGAFLSGGLDSSTVSGMLSKVSTGKAQTFSIGFDAEGYDEMEYARIASNHFSTEQNEYYVTPEDVVNLVPNIAEFIDEPFGNSSALPAYFCAKMAKDKGVDRLLAGDGGDEIFAGNERYAKQGIFDVYQTIPNFLRASILEPIFLHNPIARHIPLVKKVNSYISQAKTPLPDRLETYNYLHQHAPSEIFSADFLQQINLNEPLDLLRETYHSLDDASPLNRMMWLDWKRTLHDNDLVKVNRMCEMAGVEVVYPLLDDELVAFSCKIPSNMKIKQGNLRWFYKDAIKDFLPEQIINKTKQGFGLPFGVWTSEHKGLQNMAYTAIRTLKSRGIFRNEFLDQTIKMHQSVHAKFYGELVWVLMMLELWLAAQDKKLANGYSIQQA